MDHRNESRTLTDEEKQALFTVALKYATTKPDEVGSRIEARFRQALNHPGCKEYDQNNPGAVPQWLPSIAEQIVNDAKRYGLISGDPINEDW